MKRVCVVFACTLFWLILTINALGATPSRSVASEPQLVVTPADFTILTPISTSATYTRAVFIDNATTGTTFTWSIAISAELPLSVTAQPITGTNAATVNIQIEVSPIETAGIYTAQLIVTAEPTTTLDAPITIPVRVVAAESISRTYLPLITRNYAPPLPPPVTPPAGLAFVSSASYGHTELRYQRALAIEGRLNRWPMYWHEIESQATSQPRIYNWTAADSNIVADLDHGLTVLPILMFTPRGLETGACNLAAVPRVGDGLHTLLNQITGQKPTATPPCVTTPPQGLNSSVFSDGTDTPGPNKTINLDNRWAYFVNAAVNRYKPGGTLAQQQGWIDGRGVSFWEIWNEPDLDTFFTGTITDYARLLKVGYLAARAADPQAQIVLGGMVHWQKPSWFVSLLNLIKTDPTASANHYFMDKVAVHNYFWAWQIFGYLYPDRVQLDNHGLQDVDLWLTETGVPVCGEGSFPACDDPSNRWYRASPTEQASYLIQSATYAAWLKNEAYVWFQLFDDCGNVCGVDAYGLVRNDNTTRLAYQTYPMIFGQLTNAQPYWRDRRTLTATNWISGNQEIIAFKRPTTSERVVVMWTRYYTDATVILTATAPSAQLYLPDGSAQTIYPISGTYAISLPLATNRNMPGTTGGVAPDSTGSAPIGGSPRIVVEYDPSVK